MKENMRKFKKISDYPDTWGVSQGKLDGKPIFIRYREGLKDAIGHTDYPFQIGVATPLLQPTQDGLTGDAESVQLNVIEDGLADVLNQTGDTVHVMTITFNGMREFVFYTKEWKPEDFERKVKTVKEIIKAGHQLQFMMQPDENWETFKKYFPTPAN